MLTIKSSGWNISNTYGLNESKTYLTIKNIANKLTFLPRDVHPFATMMQFKIGAHFF